MEEFKIICNVLEGGGKGSLYEEVAEHLERAGYKAVTLGCKSKREVEYAVFQEKGGHVLLEEDGFAGEPYQAWEVAAIRDVGRASVVFLLNRHHYGTAYMDVLYAAGILDAVFEDDRGAGLVAGLLRRGRRRRESREYYGIRSLKEVSSVLQVMEQERIERYIRFIGAGASGADVRARYREVEKELTFMENCSLAENLPESVSVELMEDGGLDQYREFQKPFSRKDR